MSTAPKKQAGPDAKPEEKPVLNEVRCPVGRGCQATPRCTVGRSGNDHHYHVATTSWTSPCSEFEGNCPPAGPASGQTGAYKQKLKSLRGLPAQLQVAWKLAGINHPMGVMRTADVVLGCVLPEKGTTTTLRARDIADRLIWVRGPAVLVSLQPGNT